MARPGGFSKIAFAVCRWVACSPGIPELPAQRRQQIFTPPGFLHRRPCRNRGTNPCHPRPCALPNLFPETLDNHARVSRNDEKVGSPSSLPLADSITFPHLVAAAQQRARMYDNNLVAMRNVPSSHNHIFDFDSCVHERNFFVRFYPPTTSLHKTFSPLIAGHLPQTTHNLPIKA